MLQYARDGYSAAPDLAIRLIRTGRYAPRRAHRICATFVRTARQRGLRPYETTGALLDEAAGIADESPPGISTEEIREALDPARSVLRHDNRGDPHPEESARMITARRRALERERRRHEERLARLRRSEQDLEAAITAIIGD
jgi:argininosuccinate lyase